MYETVGELFTAICDAVRELEGAVTVFRDIPQPPYKQGDLWHMPELTVDYWLNSGLTVDEVMALGITVDDRMGGNSYVCINSRETGSFTRSDWMITGSTDKMSVVYSEDLIPHQEIPERIKIPSNYGLVTFTAVVPTAAEIMIS
jgi:hypothetical protein